MDEIGRVCAVIEAILMVADRPITNQELAEKLQLEEQIVVQALEAINARWQQAPWESGVEVRKSAGGWRIFSAAKFANEVGAFVASEQKAKLSQAALETLAIVAYQQPVTKFQLSDIRGVNVDGVLKTLLTRGFIAKHTEGNTGGTVYLTTQLFLEYLGINDLNELPPLGPNVPGLQEVLVTADSLIELQNELQPNTESEDHE